jgi:pimeloyl-ACP methyl ester carboxylesterase
MIDSNTLRRAAVNCREVYGDAKPFSSWKNNEWFWHESADVVEVTIRGSDRPTSSSGFLDWASNLDVRAIHLWGSKVPKVCRGFDPADLLEGFRQNDQVFNRFKPVRLFGHSRGGALALTVAVDLLRRGYDVAEIITFGAPRISTRWIPDLRSIPVWQFCAYGDPVWRLPCWPPFRWRHSGSVFRIGTYWTFQSLVQSFGWMPRSRAAIESHLMENYLRILKIER